MVIGAGPAGLSAAYELVRNRRPVSILEANASLVGGLSRTVVHRGFRFDIGGHRFFSKNDEIEALWTEVLGERMRERTRLSRIYYRGQFYRYPLMPVEALWKLGPAEALSCLASYLAGRYRPPADCRSFEDWAVAAFGRRLYEIFFKTYTEKVWGLPCAEISKDWAAQRIRGLDLSALVRSFLPGRDRGKASVAKSLIERFRYPDLGPGEVWQTVAEQIVRKGAEVHLGARVVRIRHSKGRVVQLVTEEAGAERIRDGDAFISSMPIGELVERMDPPPPPAVLRAAKRLRYRALVVVGLIVDQRDVFRDNWIYVHDASVRVGRIQNFKNWSPAMVPDPRYTSLGLEYFAAPEGDLLGWRDEELVDLGKRDLRALALLDESRIVDGIVIREPKAYPVYDLEYRDNVETIRRWLSTEARNLQVVGRNGMHKYDNQDHAMLTGLMAARNLLGASFDVWRVNSDAEYLEEKTAGGAAEEASAEVA